MSIETEFESTITNVKNAYQGLDNLGSTIPQNKTIENIKNCLDEIYNKFPKTSYSEGSNITLSNTLKGKLDFENDIVGYGQTSQEGTPTPDNPQEIEVVRGKNRWGGILYNGQVLGDGSINTSISTRITNVQTTTGSTTYLERGTYTISADNLDYTTLMTKNASGTILDNFTSAWHELPYTFTLTQSGYLYFSLRNSNNTNLTPSDYNVQIEKGSQATSYLPYNTIEVVERGINLLELKIPTITLNGITCINNEDGSLTFSGTATDNVNFRIDQISQSGPYVLKNYKAPYTMSLLNVEGTNKGTMYLGGYIGGSWSTQNCNIGAVAVKNENLDNAFCYIRFNKDDVINETIYPMILNGSYTASTIPPFQPYQTPQTYQLSLGEYEFAGIGNYVDTIEYDVENDKVYKNKAINKYTFTGNENWTKSGNTNNNGFLANISDISTSALKPANNNTNANVLSNYFISNSVNQLLNSGNIGIGLRSDGYVAIGTSLSGIDNVTDFKALLTNNKVLLYYILAEITKTEITGTLKDQIKALYNSHSFTGTTIIEIDGQLPLIIKVRALKGE